MNCVACQESFSSHWTRNEHLASLVHHVRLQHVQPTCRHSCPLCDFVCAELSEYSKHIDSNSHKDKLGQLRRKRAVFEDIGEPEPSSSSQHLISASPVEKIDTVLMDEKKDESSNHAVNDQHDGAPKNAANKGKPGRYRRPKPSAFDRRRHSNHLPWNEFYEPSAAEMSNFEFSCDVGMPGQPLQTGLHYDGMNDVHHWYSPGFRDSPPLMYQQADPRSGFFPEGPYMQSHMPDWRVDSFRWPQHPQMVNVVKPMENPDGGAKKSETRAQHFPAEASGSNDASGNGEKLETDGGTKKQPNKNGVARQLQNLKSQLKKKKKKKKGNITRVASEVSLGSRIRKKHPLKRKVIVSKKTPVKSNESDESRKTEPCGIGAVASEGDSVDGCKANDSSNAAEENGKTKHDGSLPSSENRCKPKIHSKSPLKMDAKMKRAFYERLALKNQAKYVHSMSLMMCRKRHDKYHLISRSGSVDEALSADGNVGPTLEDLLPQYNFMSPQVSDTGVNAVVQTGLSSLPDNSSLKGVPTTLDSVFKMFSTHPKENTGNTDNAPLEDACAALATATGRMEDSHGAALAGEDFLSPITSKTGLTAFGEINKSMWINDSSDSQSDTATGKISGMMWINEPSVRQTAESQPPGDSFTSAPSVSQAPESGRVSVKVENVEPTETDVPHVSSGYFMPASTTTGTLTETAQSADRSFPFTNVDEHGTPHNKPAVDESKLKLMWSLIAEERSLANCMVASSKRIAGLHAEISAEQEKLSKMEARIAEIRKQTDDMLRNAGDGGPLYSEQNLTVQKMEPQ